MVANAFSNQSRCAQMRLSSFQANEGLAKKIMNTAKNMMIRYLRIETITG